MPPIKQMKKYRHREATLVPNFTQLLGGPSVITAHLSGTLQITAEYTLGTAVKQVLGDQGHLRPRGIPALSVSQRRGLQRACIRSIVAIWWFSRPGKI